MNVLDVKSKCSIRGRVAFVLVIAEQCIESLHYSEKIYELARKALNDAWKWQEGEQVDGDTLYSYLENPEEESLEVYEWDSPETVENAFLAITSALAYVVWHAYRQAGIEAMPSSIHEVNDDVIDQVIEYGKRSSNIDSRLLEHIAGFLLSTCKRHSPNDLGEPVEKQLVLRSCSKG